MKKSVELKQERHSLVGELRNLSSAGLSERKLEQRETELQNKIHDLTGQIIEAEKEEERKLEEAMRRGSIIRTDDKDLKKYSFARAIRVALGYDKGGIEEEMHEEAKREISNMGQTLKGFGIPSAVLTRASTGQNVTTAADGGLLAGAGGNMMFFDALQNKLSLTRLGAQFLTGLHGTLPLVGGGTFTAAFAAEGDEITKTKAAFADRGTLTPKRLSALGAISKELIHQSSIDVERVIVAALTDSIAQAIENAAINGSGVAPNPLGILNTPGVKSVTIGDNGGAITWAKIIELETKVKQANGHGQKMNYLTNSSVTGALKTVPKVSGSDRFIMENNLVNGYSCLDTNSVPSNLSKGSASETLSAIIFGAWENLIIGQWGGLDLIVDPYTLKSRGEIELNTTQFVDLGVSNPEHFGVCKDVLPS